MRLFSSFFSGFLHVFLIMIQVLYAMEGNYWVVCASSSLIGTAWIFRLNHVVGCSKKEKIINVLGGTIGALLATLIKNTN